MGSERPESRRLLVRCSNWSGFGIGDGLVDELEELGAIDDFDKGCALAVGGGDPDGWGVLDADALA